MNEIKFIALAAQVYNGKTRYGFVANNGYTVMFAFADDEYRRCECEAKEFTIVDGDARAIASAKAFLASSLADCHRRLELIERGDAIPDSVDHINDIIERDQKLLAAI